MTRECPGDDIRCGLEQIRCFWEGRARARLPDLEKLEWTHERTQRMRFEAFLLDHDLNGKSVLDLGCGLGHFYAHLRQRGIDAEYTGYDLSAGMIRACRARYPDQRFACGNFLEYQPESRFDYTVAFGIHSIRVQGGRAIMEETTRRQFELSRIAAHVSLLTDRYTSFAPYIQAWHAEEILALALEITPHVTLRHDYLQNDFCITLHRAPISAERADLMLKYDYE